MQYPLRLAWAITIHKSQGMSLDAVEVDLSKSFERGMGYVALSRVRSIEGLTILGLNDVALRVHDEVLEVDEKLRAASERAVNELAEMDRRDPCEKAHLQTEYISRIAPSESERKSAEAKAKKISTFNQTKSLIIEGKSLAEVARSRNVTEETVIDHIEKILIEDPSFRNDALYLLGTISTKKQQTIREAFAKAYPDIAREVGKYGTPDFDPTAYRKSALAPVKHIAGANASYKEIRLIRALG